LSISVGALLPICLIFLQRYSKRQGSPPTAHPDDVSSHLTDSSDLSALLGAPQSDSFAEICDEPTTPSSVSSDCGGDSQTAEPDADIGSSIVSKLKAVETQNTIKDRTLDREHLETLKSLEQELSNQKLLNKFTSLRLDKKEAECTELQKSEKLSRAKIGELMAEIASISKKNADLMVYCQSKVTQCRAEYDKMVANTLEDARTTKRLEEEVAGFRKKDSENTLYRNECTKLRATMSTMRSQLRESTDAIARAKRENKGLRASIETQKQRLNESSKTIGKLNGDVAGYRSEIRKFKSAATMHRERMSEMTADHEELAAENVDIKQQIQRFSKQLEQQSMIQSEIIGLQQTLTKESKRSIPSPIRSARSLWSSPVKSSPSSIPSPPKSSRSMIPSPTKSVRSIRSPIVTTAFTIDRSQGHTDNAEEGRMGRGRSVPAQSGNVEQGLRERKAGGDNKENAVHHPDTMQRELSNQQ